MADVAAVEKKMDMSLDDIIKANRKSLGKGTRKTGAKSATETKGGRQRAPLKIGAKKGTPGKKVQAPKTVTIKQGVAGKRQAIKQKKQTQAAATATPAGRNQRARAAVATSGVIKAVTNRGATLRRSIASKIVSRARAGKQVPKHVVIEPQQTQKQQRRAKQQVQYSLAPAQPKQQKQVQQRQVQQQQVQGGRRGAQVLTTNQRLRQQRANRITQPAPMEVVQATSRRQQRLLRQQQQQPMVVQRQPRLQHAPMVLDDGYQLHATVGGGVRKASRQQRQKVARNPVYLAPAPVQQAQVQGGGRGRRGGRGGAQVVLQPQQQRVVVMPAPRMLPQQQIAPRGSGAMAMQQDYGMRAPTAVRAVRPEPTLVRMGVSHGGMGGAPPPAARRTPTQHRQQGYISQMRQGAPAVQRRQVQQQQQPMMMMQQGGGYGGGRRRGGGGGGAQPMHVDYY